MPNCLSMSNGGEATMETNHDEVKDNLKAGLVMLQGELKLLGSSAAVAEIDKFLIFSVLQHNMGYW
jgi:hypothetical protein